MGTIESIMAEIPTPILLSTDDPALPQALAAVQATRGDGDAPVA